MRYLIIALLFLAVYWYLSPAERRVARDFSLPIIGENDELSLASYRGQPLVLNFWATWCKNCRQEKTILTGLQKKLTVISVLTADPNPDISALAGQLTVFDKDGRVAGLYGVRHLPQTFFIDADYRLLGHWRKPLTDEVVDKYLGRLASRSSGGGR